MTARLAARLPSCSASQCEICRRWDTAALCADCVARWAAPGPRCGGCALSIGTPAERCGRCLRDPLPLDACRCAVDYTFPWDGLITAFKFHGRVELAPVLAQRLTQALSPADRAWPDLLLPVPLSTGRQRERGYNQAWELGRRVARAIDRPAQAQWLLRPRDGAHQTALGRAARRRNLQGSFALAPAARVRGLRVALVDDVLTTGATAAAAAHTLHEAGAAGVQLWALARTP